MRLDKKGAFCTVLLFILIGMSIFAFNIQPAKAESTAGTIYIMADGIISPSTANITTLDNITYTFTGNNYLPIVVNRSNIIINGNGHTLQGNGSYLTFGFSLSAVSNVTIKNTTITNSYYGIYLDSSSGNVLSDNNITANSWAGVDLFNFCDNNTLSDNSITANAPYGINLEGSADNNTLIGNNITANSGEGIYLAFSSGNVLSGNTVTANSGVGIELDAISENNTLVDNNVTANSYGVELDYSSGNVLSGNLMTSNTYNFGVVGGALSDFVNNVDTSNLVDGKPVYYLMNKSDITISPEVYPEVGYLGLVNCENVTVQGLTLTHNDIGLLLAFTNSSRITDNNITANSFGIYLDFSINNTLIGNNITGNSYGVWLDYSDNNTLFGNNLTKDGNGVVLASSSWVSISANNITDDGLGVLLASSPNNDVFGNNITANSGWGILIEPYSDNNTLAANNIAANSGDGVDLTYGSGDVLSGNNVTANLGNGVDLTYSDNNTLSGNAVTANYAAGIFLWNCSGNVLSGNDATANGGVGIDFWPNSDNNTLVGNNVTANGIDGIMLDGPCDNNTLSGNNVTANNFIGIYLLASSNNIVSWNNATANHFGIYLGYSSNNSVTGNNVNANTVGIVLQLSSGNTFYHNNFINNSQQVSIINATGQMSTTGSPNTWDNGYPSGGNYWSDYQMAYPSAIENDSSGIWNTPYVIDSNNTDRYPLMGPFNTFGVGTWNGAAYSVDTVSNSTITSLSFNATAKTLSFNVTGTSGTPGFCRVDIPTGLMSGKWTLIVGGTLYSNQTVIQSGNYTYIYFAYTQGTKTVQIQSTAAVPEFQPLVLLPLFMIITLLAAMIIKRKQNARAQSQ